MSAVEIQDVRPGDLADHVSGTLDPRPVAEVDHEAQTVRLQIGSVITDPIPMENYTYTRTEAVAS